VRHSPVANENLTNSLISHNLDIGCKLILITNRKSYMSFSLVQKSVIVNDLERLNWRYIALFISAPALYCIFSKVNTSCDEERRPVAEFMHQSIVFCITCRMSS